MKREQFPSMEESNMRTSKIHFQKDVSDNQYRNINWQADSGLSHEQLTAKVLAMTREHWNSPRPIVKARALELIAKEARLAIDPQDIFQEKFDAVGIINKQRALWVEEYYAKEGAEDLAIIHTAASVSAFSASYDFGHLSSNLQWLFEEGISGILAQIRTAKAQHGEHLTESQQVFYDSCEIAMNAMSVFILRLAEAIRPYNEDNYLCLQHIAYSGPSSLYEALQLMLVYFNVHENIFGSRIRTLGRLDVLLYPYYIRDLREGRYAPEELREMLRFFLNKLWAMNVAYGLPFELGGIDKDGREVTNELSYEIVTAYTELNIYSPKLHIRISDQTPKDFILLILSAIRQGNSSFVFANDSSVIKALMKVGISEADARNYVYIGCYEPAVYAHEIGCTGNGGINGAKMLELALNRGRDQKSGALIGVDTGEITSFEELMAAVKEQIRYAVDICTSAVCHIEAHYGELNPEPLISALLQECLISGVDAFAGGARYNNSSLSFNYIATLTDSLAAIKRIVYEEQSVTLAELTDILHHNWLGQEDLRRHALSLPEKYGNNDSVADRIMQELLCFEANLINNQPNGRGGVFKASMISIDHYVRDGANVMATPDGRKAGTPLSKNIAPVTGMDRKGITALIHSVGKIDYTDYPNGTVLDIVLHPSAVSGDDGLEALYAILMTYFRKGGISLHGNVFDAETLRKAQQEPEKYATLQVRVCGWNAYFLNLSAAEQEDFIQKAAALYPAVS